MSPHFSGTVQAHVGRGAQLGYPTANIETPPGVAEGVYAGYAIVHEQRYDAAIFIGPAITFGEQKSQCEVHILDYSGDLYGETIHVELVKYIRGNQRFASAQELRKQIAIDIIAIKSCLQELSKQ